ncbi:MAG: general secretion pathway protein GspK, partial [Pseudomonadota bacterium]|nr:general secretion pathway protein GspK [Pseudomonadota bacterium]
MALLVVLWTLLLIGIVGASLSSQARKQGLLARNGVAIARAEAAAEGGVIRAITAMVDPRPDAIWRADGTVHRFMLDAIPIEVRIVDEAGKVDINAASPDLLASLLQICGASPDAAFEVASSVADLRR